MRFDGQHAAVSGRGSLVAILCVLLLVVVLHRGPRVTVCERVAVGGLAVGCLAVEACSEGDGCVLVGGCLIPYNCKSEQLD